MILRKHCPHLNANALTRLHRRHKIYLFIERGLSVSVVLPWVYTLSASSPHLRPQVLNKTVEFEAAVRRVLKDVKLDNDIVVSVFETNIRVLG